jgi:hypothetical protein
MRDILLFVQRFNCLYGRGHPPPRPDFFWESPGYAELLDGIARASREHVEFIAHIPNAELQRGRFEPFFFD